MLNGLCGPTTWMRARIWLLVCIAFVPGGCSARSDSTIRLVANSSESDHVEPSVAVHPDGSIHVAWMECFSFEHRRILYACSRDGSAPFSPPRVMGGSKTAEAAWDPSITVDRDGVVYLAWVEGELSRPMAQNVKLSVSHDGGQSWKEAQVVATPTGRSRRVDRPWICANGDGQILLTWVDIDCRFSGTRLFYRSSRDAGITFSDPVLIAQSEGSIVPGGMVSHGLTVVIGYGEILPENGRRVTLSVSRDGGKTFSMYACPGESGEIADAHPTDVPGPTPDAGVWPSVALSGNNVYMAWVFKKDAVAQVKLARFSILESKYVAIRELEFSKNDHVFFPTLVVDDVGTLHLAYLGGQSRAYDAYHTSSNDGGASFGPPRLLSSVPFRYASRHPGDFISIAWRQGVLAIAWPKFDGEGGGLNLSLSGDYKRR